MATSRRLPPAVEASGERVARRPYESDFARLPPEETVHQHEPGAGPRGTISTGPRNWPLALVTVGFVLLFVTIGAGHWWPLAAGGLLMGAGAVWAAARNAPLTLNRGIGTVRVDVVTGRPRPRGPGGGP